MNYPLFDQSTTEQITVSSRYLNTLIDQNYSQTDLDTVRQAEYDNLKYIVTALHIASFRRLSV